MKVLFDQNVPRKLRRYLAGHQVSTAFAMGWDRAVNGDLLRLAQDAAFDVFVTCDQNLSYQQDMTGRTIAIVELTSNNWPIVMPHVEEIAATINASVPGSYLRVVCGS